MVNEITQLKERNAKLEQEVAKLREELEQYKKQEQPNKTLIDAFLASIKMRQQK